MGRLLQACFYAPPHGVGALCNDGRYLSVCPVPYSKSRTEGVAS